MVEAINQPALQPNVQDALDSANANVSQAATPREQVAALAKQFQLTQGVARALYRGIIQKDPKATGASLLAQFAQAVSKRKLDQTQKAGQKAAVATARDTDTLTQGTPDGQIANKFLAAAPMANASGLSQQAYKQVTTNPQAGPVLPPPAQQDAGDPAYPLAQTLGRSKIALLDPNHPNWAAFYVLLRDSWDAHTIDRMMQSQFDAFEMQKVQVTSLQTGAMLTEANVQKERNDVAFGAATGMLGINESIRSNAAKALINSNSVEDVNSLDIVNAGDKAQHQGPFRDMLREDAISVMAGLRDPGAPARFMDANARTAQADRTDMARGKGAENKARSLIKQYLAPTDAAAVAGRNARKGIVDKLKNNGSLEGVDLDGVILSQAIPGTPAEAERGENAQAPTHVIRRFLTKAEIANLSAPEQKQYKSMLEAFYGARISDWVDRVQAAQQEVGRLRSAALTARNEARDPKRLPLGSDVGVYRKNCTLMADAFDRKATALKKELVDGNEIGKQVYERLAMTNRTSMRQVMQHAGWLRNLAEQVKSKSHELNIILKDPTHEESLSAKQRMQVMEETAFAINRRLFDLYQSIQSYRGDAHQPQGQPLQRNERLDQFKTAPGAKLYNEKWDAYEALQGKGTARSAKETAEMVDLRTSLKYMHLAAPAHVWETWKLERLQTKVETVSRDPSRAAEVAPARDALNQAVDTAKTRVDEKWLGFVMERHVKARHADLLKEANGKAVAETDPVKKRALIQAESDLKVRLASSEAHWKETFQRTKADTIKHKAQTAATTLGFGPRIIYKTGGGRFAEPLAPRGQNAGIMADLAATRKNVETIKSRRVDAAHHRAATPAQAQRAREDAADAHNTAYKAAQDKFEHGDSPDVRADNDAWLGHTGDPHTFEHVDPGVDYNDPAALNKRLTEANEAMGASAANWDDRGLDEGTPVMDALRGFGDTMKGVDSAMQGVPDNLIEETAQEAAGLIQEVQGDFSAMYDQIMAMRSRLLPLVAKINPWG